jgi:microcompartment protein CcmK/EutM
MKLARVIGTVVASVQHRAYDGQTVLLCEPVDSERAPTGGAFIAVDRAQAGVGDLVLINAEGNGARQIFGIDPKGKLPIIDVIVGVVDHAEESWR